MTTYEKYQEALEDWFEARKEHSVFDMYEVERAREYAVERAASRCEELLHRLVKERVEKELADRTNSN